MQEYAGTVIAVTHDRYFLDNVAGWILELDRGHGIPWKGNYSSWLEQKQQRLAQEEKAASARQKTLERELEWLHMSPKAQQTKRKSRINAYNELLSQEMERAREEREIYIAPGPRLGDVVIHAEGIAKAFGDNLLYDDLTFDVPPGAIVGIIGPNGAGKTTLFRMIVGQDEPDAGDLTVGNTVNWPMWTRAATRSTPTRRCGRRSPRATSRLKLGDRTGQLARLCGPLQLCRAGPAEEGRPAFRRRAQPRPPGQDAQVRRQRHPPG